ncbi:hypothetical protein GCM10022235_16040 [Kribbella ginsengisoli]|uniref:Uncharacterized protein n=1 Tax=Kribbella ginsengisoli TaxID=363865 RepID=A0ABP6WF44_9ACTN
MRRQSPVAVSNQIRPSFDNPTGTHEAHEQARASPNDSRLARATHSPVARGSAQELLGYVGYGVAGGGFGEA